MSQPAIKIMPNITKPSPAEEHAYQPEPVAPKKEEKPIGQMYADEFTELMVKAIIQADKVKESLVDKDFKQEEVNRTPVEKALGTVGDVAHGVVDMAEGILRGAVDIVTFGKSRRK